MVTRDGISENDVKLSDDTDSDRIMSTLKFGCNAVFGHNSTKKQTLPSDEDIELITDRSRTEDFSDGKLKGNADTNAKEFDVTKDFTSTTDFAGIDFKKIRKDYEKKKCPKNLGHITDMWKKRQRKNRIKMIDCKNSGYGKSSVPVLSANDYDLESGERSVFERELSGRSQVTKKSKHIQSFVHQDFCQTCGDGGELVCCPRCPVTVHAACDNIQGSCSHHRCSICEKAASHVGGFLFPCSACPNAYCEDHLPKEACILDDGCERMEALGYGIKKGAYVHCSKQCQRVAVEEFEWTPGKSKSEKARAPCPSPLDMSRHFGAEVNDSVDTPEELIVHGKRNRKKVNNSTIDLVNGTPPNLKSHESIDKCAGTPSSSPADRSDSSGCNSTSFAEEEEKLASTKTASLVTKGSITNDTLEYGVCIPVTPHGLLITVGPHQDGSVAFREYRRAPDGSSGPAEIAQLFRNEGDEIIAIDGACCTGASLKTTMDVLRRSAGPYMLLRMRHKMTVDEQKSMSDTYGVCLPVTPHGLLLAVKEFKGLAVFLNYKKSPSGPGPAERVKLLRGVGDAIISINGEGCIGMRFEEVVDKIKAHSKKGPFVYLRMEHKSHIAVVKKKPKCSHLAVGSADHPITLS
jgi:hypothetical protein